MELSYPPPSLIRAKFGMQEWTFGVLFHVQFQVDWYIFATPEKWKPSIWPIKYWGLLKEKGGRVSTKTIYTRSTFIQ